MELRLNESDREAMVAFLRDLIRIPSTSTNEGKVVERTAAEMRRLGFHGVFIDPVGSVLGQIGVRLAILRHHKGDGIEP